MTDFEKVIDLKNLYKAYRKVKCGKGTKYSANKFSTMALDGLIRLKESLVNKTYKMSDYYEFKIYEPKERVIKAASFKDKIVQHSLCDNVLLPKLSEIFIRNSFAGQIGKGTLFGLNTLRNDMGLFKDGYILKGDITKFFYSIDHELLKDIIDYYFTDKNIRWLCHLIIDSTDGKGLPLGNQTSQVFGLLYLDGLDKFIKTELCIEFYGRYMDDFYIFHKSKEYLKYCLENISAYVNSLGLSLNGKTQIHSFKNGIKFLGFYAKRIGDKTVLRLRGENKRRAKRKYFKMAKLVESGEITKEKYKESLQSWQAHACFGDCENLIKIIKEKDNGVQR